MSEYRLHMACLEHCRSAFIHPGNTGLKIMHVRNETRSAEDAFWGKRMGVEPGFSDFILGWSPGKVGVCEIKLPNRPISSAQNKFLSWADWIGWKTGKARTVRQFHDTLIGWGLKAVHAIVAEPDYATNEEKLRRGEEFFKP